MNIAILWTGVTAPMTACWRTLAALPDVRLTTFIELHRHAQTAYVTRELLAGVDHRVRFSDEPLHHASLVDQISVLQPDLMIVLGWRSAMCRAASESRVLSHVPKLLAFDMPFKFTLRKLLAPLVLRRYLQQFDGAFVPGARSAQYARWLGFSEDRIARNLAGLDTAPFAIAAATRKAKGGHPRRFLYVGRYAREKGMDVLVKAYAIYRESVYDPWPLTCCGMGPEAFRLRGAAGIHDLGFVQPKDLPAIYGEHGAFVLPSRYEPWGFVIQEAAAAGLPIVCTSACGAATELVQPLVSGLICPPNDATALAKCLRWIHEHPADLVAMGSRGTALVEPFSNEQWARQVVAMAHSLADAATQRR